METGFGSAQLSRQQMHALCGGSLHDLRTVAVIETLNVWLRQ
jgi:hypothetical protein